MANVLMLDDDPVAQKAAWGILEETNHQFWVFEDEQSSWDFLQNFTAIDLVILEVRLSCGVQMGLLRRLRKHFFYKTLPVVIYSKLKDKDIVRSAVELGIQNYLLKPYSAKLIHDEIEKALDARWQENYIEQPEVVCARLGISQAQYQSQLSELGSTVSAGVKKLQEIAVSQSFSQCQALVNDLTDLGQKTGCLVLNDIALEINNAARKDQWDRIPKWIPDFSILSKMIETRTSTSTTLGDIATYREREDFSSKQTISSDMWKQPEFEDLCPLLEQEDVLGAIKSLQHFPVIDTSAASLQLALRGDVLDFNALEGYFNNDPALVTELLRFSSNIAPQNSMMFEDPLSVFNILGEQRMKSMQSDFVTFPEKSINNEFYNYKSYVIRQIARARLCREIASSFGMLSMGTIAYWTAFLKDIGVLLFYYLYPDHYKNVLAISAAKTQPLLVSEALVFGTTHEIVGFEFARANHFPSAYQSVIRFSSNPAQACEEERDLVALVSLADYLCKSYGFNYVESTLSHGYCNFREHPTWEILSKRIVPGFSFVTFDKMIRKMLISAKYDTKG